VEDYEEQQSELEMEIQRSDIDRRLQDREIDRSVSEVLIGAGSCRRKEM
jgi:hypothetical protein